MKKSKVYAFLNGDSMLKQIYDYLVKSSENLKFIVNTNVFLSAKIFDKYNYIQKKKQNEILLLICTHFVLVQIIYLQKDLILKSLLML